MAKTTAEKEAKKAAKVAKKADKEAKKAKKKQAKKADKEAKKAAKEAKKAKKKAPDLIYTYERPKTLIALSSPTKVDRKALDRTAELWARTVDHVRAPPQLPTNATGA